MDWKLIAAPFVILLRFIGKLLKNKLGLILIAVVVVVILISSQQGAKATAPVEPYNKNVPGVNQAPTIIQTTSRIYYVKDYTDDGKVLMLQNFYYYDKDRWLKNKTELPIDRAVYKEIRIAPRSN